MLHLLQFLHAVFAPPAKQVHIHHAVFDGHVPIDGPPGILDDPFVLCGDGRGLLHGLHRLHRETVHGLEIADVFLRRQLAPEEGPHEQRAVGRLLPIL